MAKIDEPVDPTLHTRYEREGVVLQPDGGTARVDLGVEGGEVEALHASETVPRELTKLRDEPHLVMVWVEHSPQAVDHNPIATELVSRTYPAGDETPDIYGPVYFTEIYDDGGPVVETRGLNDVTRSLVFDLINGVRPPLPAGVTAEPTDPPVNEFTLENAYLEKESREAAARQAEADIAEAGSDGAGGFSQ